jgi:hypothetical protein
MSAELPPRIIYVSRHTTISLLYEIVEEDGKYIYTDWLLWYLGGPEIYILDILKFDTKQQAQEYADHRGAISAV